MTSEAALENVQKGSMLSYWTQSVQSGVHGVPNQ